MGLGFCSCSFGSSFDLGVWVLGVLVLGVFGGLSVSGKGAPGLGVWDPRNSVLGVAKP